MLSLSLFSQLFTSFNFISNCKIKSPNSICKPSFLIFIIKVLGLGLFVFLEYSIKTKMAKSTLLIFSNFIIMWMSYLTHIKRKRLYHNLHKIKILCYKQIYWINNLFCRIQNIKNKKLKFHLFQIIKSESKN